MENKEQTNACYGCFGAANGDCDECDKDRRDKEMTNREKHAKEILDIACSGDKLAMRKADKRLTGCNKLECNGCCFSGTGRCSEVIQKWAESEYIESPVISKADRAFWSISKKSISILQEIKMMSYTHTMQNHVRRVRVGIQVALMIGFV